MGRIGVLTGLRGDVNPLPAPWKKITLQGIFVGSDEMFEGMNRATAQAKLQPVVDCVFPFAKARDVFEYLSSGARFGKVVITV